MHSQFLEYGVVHAIALILNKIANGRRRRRLLLETRFHCNLGQLKWFIVSLEIKHKPVAKE